MDLKEKNERLEKNFEEKIKIISNLEKKLLDNSREFLNFQIDLQAKNNEIKEKDTKMKFLEKTITDKLFLINLLEEKIYKENDNLNESFLSNLSLDKNHRRIHSYNEILKKKNLTKVNTAHKLNNELASNREIDFNEKNMFLIQNILNETPKNLYHGEKLKLVEDLMKKIKNENKNKKF